MAVSRVIETVLDGLNSFFQSFKAVFIAVTETEWQFSRHVRAVNQTDAMLEAHFLCENQFALLHDVHVDHRCYFLLQSDLNSLFNNIDSFFTLVGVLEALKVLRRLGWGGSHLKQSWSVICRQEQSTFVT